MRNNTTSKQTGLLCSITLLFGSGCASQTWRCRPCIFVSAGTSPTEAISDVFQGNFHPTCKGLCAPTSSYTVLSLQVGFLCDWRRMNVAITRAKRGLVVLGNTSTLERGDPHWAALVQHFRGSGCITPSVQTLC